jgi:inosine-uridine nucleoside N-ribohydrolase
MQATPQEKPPVGIIFDSDIGNDIDDVLALALLQGFEGSAKPEARLVSVSVTKSNLKAAAFCEAVDRFFSAIADRDTPPRFRRFRGLPVGFTDDGMSPEDTPLLTVPLAKRDASGEPVYPHGIKQLNDTAEPLALIRNAFTAHHDQNAVVVLAGRATNLARVLDLPGTRELISSKVRFLVIAGGAFPEGGPEPAIQADIAAAQKLFANWPTPIVAAGMEIGLLYPASSIQNDFGWAENHPVVDAYKAYRPMPYDAPTTAMAAALYAVRPEAGYFRLSEPGVIRVSSDGKTHFSEAADGRHRYLIADPAQKEAILEICTKTISAMPAPRELPNFLKRLIEQEKKEEEEKKLRELQEKQAKPPEQ